MAQARPRESLLNMFDPLSDAETILPSSSGDLSSSDKENAPSSAARPNPLGMTAFFDRAHAPHKPATPRALKKGALIDFDVSMASDDSTEDEQDENVGVKREAAATTPRRTVLGEIRVEQAQALGLLDATPLRAQARSAPPFGGSPANAAKHRATALSAPSSPELPSISVHAPDAATASPPAPRSPTSPTTAHAKGRQSLDAHASFDLSSHLSNASFDLLTDRISFVGCDSLLSNESMDVDVFSPSASAGANETLGLGMAEESDGGGLADESDTASEAGLGGSLSGSLGGSMGNSLAERLADLHMYIDSEEDGEDAPAHTFAAHTTPKPPAASSASKPQSARRTMQLIKPEPALADENAPPRAVPRTFVRRTSLAPGVTLISNDVPRPSAPSDEDAPPQMARRRSIIVPRSRASLAPAAAPAGLVSNEATTVPAQPAAPRVTKKPAPAPAPAHARRVSLAPVPAPTTVRRAAPPATSAATARSAAPSTTHSRASSVAAPAPAPARARTFVAPPPPQPKPAPAKARTSIAPPSSTTAGVLRPTQASLMKGAAAARAPAAAPRASGVPAAAAPTTLRRAPPVSAARAPVRSASAAQPAAASASGKTATAIRPPSRFGAATAASAARKPAVPAAASVGQASGRDVAKILRGPGVKRT